MTPLFRPVWCCATSYPFFQDENSCFGILFAHSHSRPQSDDSPSDDFIVIHGWNWALTIYRRATTALNASFRGAFFGKKKPPRTGRARRPRWLAAALDRRTSPQRTTVYSVA